MSNSPQPCGASHPLIDGGALCARPPGHEKVGLPHTTESGLWWQDTVEDQ
jgi:hypothetical protein